MADTRALAAEAPRLERGWASLEDVLDRIDAAERPTVALSITGGGASGAWQAGVIAALLEAIERRRRERGACKASPRLVIGTSAGALNAFAFLLQSLRPRTAAAPEGRDEPLVTSVWRAIGEGNHGARFVTGRRAPLLAWITRWRKWRPLRWTAALVAGVIGLALVNPVLLGIVARGPEPVASLGKAILARPVLATALGAALLVIALGVVFLTFGRALFRNAALQSTLAQAARACLAGEAPSYRGLRRRMSLGEQQRVAAALVSAWARAPDAPELIVTATDLTARWECLFALASQERCRLLAERSWEVGRIGPGTTATPLTARHLAAVPERDLLRCVVASTSIPGVFPSQRIRMSRLDGSGRDVVHDFVDGGVLNNSPMNVALDAGATHVISIELDPLKDVPPLDAAAPSGGEPLVPENLGETFATLLNLATTEDVVRTVEANHLRAQRSSAPMHVYRIAPPTRDLGTLDFDGHYVRPFAAPSPSLVTWMESGARHARDTDRPFWIATYEPAP